MMKASGGTKKEISESGQLEWLVTDGTGVFALGCLDHIPRRKYHSLLSIADGLMLGGGRNLILDLGEELKSGETRIPLSAAPQTFNSAPTPTWSWEMSITDTRGESRRVRIERRIQALKHCCREHLEAGMKLSYSFSSLEKKKNSTELFLLFEPKLLSRPIHSLTRKNPALDGHARHDGDKTWEFQLYADDPKIVFSWSGTSPTFSSNGHWEKVEHSWEASRGYDSSEECFVPGQFIVKWDGTTELHFSVHLGYKDARSLGLISVPTRQKPHHECSGEEAPLSPSASRSARLKHQLSIAAQSFAADVQVGESASPTLLAGLPWFGPWARDLFVCIPGYAYSVKGSELPYLMMVTGGKRLIQDFSGATSQGMNTHGADTPWLYHWALEQLVRQNTLSRVQERVLLELGADIAYSVLRGAQPGVHAEARGGLRIEAGPWAKTWMDVTTEGRPVTPRHGFPIEVNALFINGLGFLLEHARALGSHPGLPKIREAYEASQGTFMRLFCASGSEILGDVFSERYPEGSGDLDLSIRPNCLWALALPRIRVPEKVALNTLRMVRSHLLTPVGLRSLSPSDRSYHGQCVGDQKQRDQAYHQGTVWPWLLGVYADAVLRWEGAATLQTDLKPVWERIEHHLNSEGCIGEVSEIFDGDAPHEQRGAPAQAWSACELLRVLERGAST